MLRFPDLDHSLVICVWHIKQDKAGTPEQCGVCAAPPKGKAKGKAKAAPKPAKATGLTAGKKKAAAAKGKARAAGDAPAPAATDDDEPALGSPGDKVPCMSLMLISVAWACAITWQK